MREVATGVWLLKGRFVNVWLLEGRAGECVLVDSGFSYWKQRIESALSELAKRRLSLSAIVLTHGHPDHSGTARFFADRYNVPIYVHEAELPFVSGQCAYPPPDPTIGGPHAFVTRFVENGARDLGHHVRTFDCAGEWCAVEGHLAELPGWRWIHTPGHSPGHIALFRESDGVMLAGDALAGANFDSWRSALKGERGVWRGESPYICNWGQAQSSVRLLAMLRPRLVLCSHGPPLSGKLVAQELGAFAERYPVPKRGRYVNQPARLDIHGALRVPPAPFDRGLVAACSAALIGALGWQVVARRRLSRSSARAAQPKGADRLSL